MRQLSGTLAGPSSPSDPQPSSNSKGGLQQQSPESNADAAARRAWRKARAILDEPPPSPSEVASTYSPSTSAIASEAAAKSAALAVRAPLVHLLCFDLLWLWRRSAAATAVLLTSNDRASILRHCSPSSAGACPNLHAPAWLHSAATRGALSETGTERAWPGGRMPRHRLWTQQLQQWHSLSLKLQQASWKRKSGRLWWALWALLQVLGSQSWAGCSAHPMDPVQTLIFCAQSADLLPFTAEGIVPRSLDRTLSSYAALQSQVVGSAVRVVRLGSALRRSCVQGRGCLAWC